MTREREDDLLARLQEVRRQSRRLTSRVLKARMAGRCDEEAIALLAKLSREQAALTSPVFEAA